MLRAGALAATLLVLVPATGLPILGRLLVLRELWPEHVEEYQQKSVAAMKIGLYKAQLRMILEHSTLKMDSKSPSVERTKRSTKGEHAQISVAFLKHLTSVLGACAIFGMALSVLSLAGCYLYYKRRELKPFLDIVLKGGESLQGSKASDPNCCTPASQSQSSHAGQTQESNKNKTAMARGSEIFSKELKRGYVVGTPKRSIMLILWKMQLYKNLGTEKYISL